MEEAERLLREFPGPVTLHPNPGKWLLLFLFGIFCGGFMLHGAITGAVEGFELVLFWICGVFFAACSPLILLRMGPKANSLTLTADGFECRHPNDTRSVRWDELRDFSIVTAFLLDDMLDSGTVRYSSNAPGEQRNAEISGGLPDNYGLPASALLFLMKEWHARALAETRRAATDMPSTGAQQA